MKMRVDAKEKLNSTLFNEREALKTEIRKLFISSSRPRCNTLRQRERDSLAPELTEAKKTIGELVEARKETVVRAKEVKAGHCWNTSVNLIKRMWEHNKEMDFSFLSKEYQVEILWFQAEDAGLNFEYPDSKPKESEIVLISGDKENALTAVSLRTKNDQAKAPEAVVGATSPDKPTDFSLAPQGDLSSRGPA